MPRLRLKPRTETDNDLMTTLEVRLYFGGDQRPITLQTLQRGIDAGRIPKPFYITPAMRRWKRSEVIAARAKMVGSSYPGGPEPPARDPETGAETTDG